MIQYDCRRCGKPISDTSGVDPNVPWVHQDTGNMFCAVDGFTPVFTEYVGAHRQPEEEVERQVAAPPRYGYIALWKGHRLELYADTLLAAQQLAATELGAPRRRDVTVALAEVDGEDYVHTAVD